MPGVAKLAALAFQIDTLPTPMHDFRKDVVKPGALIAVIQRTHRIKRSLHKR
jgi:hypothetical protein